VSKDKPGTSSVRIPSPAHPHQRVEPLPGHCRKGAEEDPEAPRCIDAILASPSYRRADQDIDFLSLDETRGPRLELDYLKPELLMRQNDIEHTIVVFGSARIPEPAEATRRLEKARRSQGANPGDGELERQLRVAERVADKSRYYDIAREFGRIVGNSGSGPGDSRVVLMTGGGPGIMEGANRGAFDVEAKSIGLNITLPLEQYPNPYISPELCFSVWYFAIRKLHFLLRAKGLVVFPGGYGTLDELFETLTLIQTRKIKPLPVVLVGERYWRGVFDPDFLVDEGALDPEDRDLFWYAETAEEIWNGILSWHIAAGEPLTNHPA
jgi:hypothetical protein